MIVVDTSVWVDHLRRGGDDLARLLERGAVLMHPFVVGKSPAAAWHTGNPILDLLQDLPAAVVAEQGEVLPLSNDMRPTGEALAIHVHLLASVRGIDGRSTSVDPGQAPASGG